MRHPIPDPRLEFSKWVCSLEVLRVGDADRRFDQGLMRFNVRRKIYETKMCNLDPRHAYGIATARFDEIQRNNLALGREVLDVELFSVYLSEWLGLSLPE